MCLRIFIFKIFPLRTFHRLGSTSSHTNSQYKETTNDQLAGITMDSPTSSPLNSLSSITVNNPMLGAAGTSIGATERVKDLAICAVLLDEWLKELSAISQEQCIIMLDDRVSEVARKA
jgi:KELAA motif